MKKFLNNENGYSFLMVFFTMVLITILGVGLISVSANSLKTSTNERNDQSVYYIAEAGLATKKSEVEKEILGFYQEIKDRYDKLPPKKKPEYKFETEFYTLVKNEIDLSPMDLEDFESQFGNSPKAHVEISKKSSGITPLEYKITSVGTIGKKERTVSQIITIDLNMDKPPSNSGGKYAVHTKGNLEIFNGPQITGSIATQFGEIIFDKSGSDVTGDIYTSIDNISIPIDKRNRQSLIDKVKGHDSFPQNVLPTFPDEEFTRLEALPYPEDLEVKISDYNKTLVINKGRFLADNWMTDNFQYNVTNDVHFKEFKVTNSKNITINIGNNDKNLFIEKLDIDGHIKIIGNGILNIYVKESVRINGSIISNDGYNEVKIYDANTSKLTIGGNTKITGSLYAKNAELELANGIGIQGNIYTGGSSLKISGGANAHTQHFYAPNAKVEVLEGAHIIGSIIADSFIAKGGVSVTFESSTNGGSNGVTEYPDSISLTKKSSIIEEN